MTTMETLRRTTSPVAVSALGVALLTGVAADMLLRTERLGINLWILSVVFQILLLVLHRRHHTSIPWASFALMSLSGFFLLSFAWRDAPALNAMALVASATAAGVAAWQAQGASLLRSTPIQYLMGIGRSAGAAAVGVLPLALHDADWSPFRTTWSGSGVGKVGRGIALAIPPVILFGALFAAADPIFRGFYSQIFRFDLESLMVHCVIIGCVGWAVAGFLRELVVPDLHPLNPRPMFSGGHWGYTEVMTVLGSVTLVFLLFVAIQIRTLFGGNAFVLAETGLTYAEYARQGFFHMAWAAALVLPLVLFLEWIGRREGAGQERSFRILAIMLLLLLGLVLISAVHRMQIYQASYGLTELRVYTVAFMAWLAPVLGWFGCTVLAGRRERFVPGALSLALATVLVLHLINPDRMIASTNLERRSQGQELDIRHAISLSDDAMPTLARSLESLSLADQCVLIARMKRQPDEWRSWNRSRDQMQALLLTMSDKVAQLARSCPVQPS
jgi:hypothetical protein